LNHDAVFPQQLIGRLFRSRKAAVLHHPFDVREGVERALGFATGHAGNFIEGWYQPIAPALKFSQHLFDRLLRPGQRGDGGLLGD